MFWCWKFSVQVEPSFKRAFNKTHKVYVTHIHTKQYSEKIVFYVHISIYINYELFLNITSGLYFKKKSVNNKEFLYHLNHAERLYICDT